MKYRGPLLEDQVKRILKYRFGIAPEAPDSVYEITGTDPSPEPDSASSEPLPTWDAPAFAGVPTYSNPLPDYTLPLGDIYPLPLGGSYGMGPDPFNPPFGGEYLGPDPFMSLDNMFGF